ARGDGGAGGDGEGGGVSAAGGGVVRWGLGTRGFTGFLARDGPSVGVAAGRAARWDSKLRGYGKLSSPSPPPGIRKAGSSGAASISFRVPTRPAPSAEGRARRGCVPACTPRMRSARSTGRTSGRGRGPSPRRAILHPVCRGAHSRRLPYETR